MTWRDSLPRSIRTFVVSFSDFLHSLANFIFRASSYSVVPWMHIELEENHLMIYDVNSLVRVDVPIFLWNILFLTKLAQCYRCKNNYNPSLHDFLCNYHKRTWIVNIFKVLNMQSPQKFKYFYAINCWKVNPLMDAVNIVIIPNELLLFFFRSL